MINAIHLVPRRVFLSLVGLCAVFGASLLLLLWWFTFEANTNAKHASVALISAVVNAEVDHLGQMTLGYARQNTAHPMHAGQTHDKHHAGYHQTESAASVGVFPHALWLLGPDGTPRQLFDRPTHDGRAVQFDPAIAAALSRRVAEMPQHGGASASGLAWINGAVAVMAAGPVQANTPHHASDADAPILVTARFLDPAALSHLAKAVGMSGPLTFDASGQPLLAGQAALPLRDLTGQPIGSLIWTAPRPGDVVAFRTIPVLLAVIFVLIALSLVVGRATAAQAQLLLAEHQRARTDQLTGAQNSTALAEMQSSPSMRQALRDGHVAIVYIDINDFKLLNDEYGHTVGDRALMEVSEKLHAVAAPDGMVFRKGGDEFVIILHGANPRPQAVAMMQALAAPLVMNRRADLPDVQITLSVGIAVSSGTHSWGPLMTEADRAMYRAKRRRARRAENGQGLFAQGTPRLV